jgi:hypothetical protein
MIEDDLKALELRVSELENQLQAKSKRGTRLPDDWTPDEKLITWVKKERPDVDVPVQVETFRNHWHTCSKNAVKLKWHLAFKNWILNARALHAAKNGYIDNSSVARVDRANEAARARERGEGERTINGAHK